MLEKGRSEARVPAFSELTVQQEGRHVAPVGDMKRFALVESKSAEGTLGRNAYVSQGQFLFLKKI